MYRIAASLLDRWRYAKRNEKARVELVSNLARLVVDGVQIPLPSWPAPMLGTHTDPVPTSEPARVGNYVHDLFKRLAEGEEVRCDEEPVEFVQGIIRDLPALGYQHEVPVQRAFEVNGQPCILRGRLDALSPDGIAWEYKTTDSWKGVDSWIRQAYQWRCYLWAKPDLVRLSYCVFIVRYGGRRPKVVDVFQGFPKEPHESLGDDVQYQLERLVAWIEARVPGFWGSYCSDDDGLFKRRDIPPVPD